jgi:hypothetical protein
LFSDSVQFGSRKIRFHYDAVDTIGLPMNHSLKLWARRAVRVAAALALVVSFTGVAQAHDDEDYGEDYEEGYAPPVHVGPLR